MYKKIILIFSLCLFFLIGCGTNNNNFSFENFNNLEIVKENYNIQDLDDNALEMYKVFGIESVYCAYHKNDINSMISNSTFMFFEFDSNKNAEDYLNITANNAGFDETTKFSKNNVIGYHTDGIYYLVKDKTILNVTYQESDKELVEDIIEQLLQ